MSVTLAASVCGSQGGSPSPETRRFETTDEVVSAPRAGGFNLRACGHPEPTVVSERGVQCRHIASDDADEAVAIDIYATNEQEDRARDYIPGAGSWADTVFGDLWSVSTDSRESAREVRRILGAG